MVCWRGVTDLLAGRLRRGYAGSPLDSPLRGQVSWGLSLFGYLAPSACQWNSRLCR